MSNLLSTIGFRADFEQYTKPVDVKVWFEKQGDTVKVWCENFRTGGKLHKLGVKTITRQQLSDMPEDPYNDMVFFKEAIALFGGRMP